MQKNTEILVCYSARNAVYYNKQVMTITIKPNLSFSVTTSKMCVTQQIRLGTWSKNYWVDHEKVFLKLFFFRSQKF
jgi:hypothetical protein